MPLQWCIFIGAYNGVECTWSDGVVPVDRQDYPGGTENRSVIGPSHTEETRSQLVEDELRQMFTNLFQLPQLPPPPAPRYATISGPSQIRPESCHWHADTDVVDPVFEWQVNGSVVGSSPDLYYSHPQTDTEFDLYLAVTSATGGEPAYDGRIIMVSWAYGDCNFGF